MRFFYNFTLFCAANICAWRRNERKGSTITKWKFRQKMEKIDIFSGFRFSFENCAVVLIFESTKHTIEMECMCAAFSKLMGFSIQFGWNELMGWCPFVSVVCMCGLGCVCLLSSFDKLNYCTQSGIKIPWLQHLFDDMFDILARTINFRFHFIRMQFDMKLNLWHLC